MKRSHSRIFTVLLCCLVGCADSGPPTDATVQGTVTIDGELATRGTVTLHPDGDGPVAVGQIHPDGSYAARIGLGRTADPDAAQISAGKYFVTVMVMGDAIEDDLVGEGGPPKAGPRLTAKKYASKATSGLVFNVKPGANVFSLELESSANDPPDEVPAEQSEGAAETAEETGDEASASEAVESATESTSGEVATEPGQPAAQTTPSTEVPAAEKSPPASQEGAR